MKYEQNPAISHFQTLFYNWNLQKNNPHLLSDWSGIRFWKCRAVETEDHRFPFHQLQQMVQYYRVIVGNTSIRLNLTRRPKQKCFYGFEHEKVIFFSNFVVFSNSIHWPWLVKFNVILSSFFQWLLTQALVFQYL